MSSTFLHLLRTQVCSVLVINLHLCHGVPMNLYQRLLPFLFIHYQEKQRVALSSVNAVRHRLHLFIFIYAKKKIGLDPGIVSIRLVSGKATAYGYNSLIHIHMQIKALCHRPEIMLPLP